MTNPARKPCTTTTPWGRADDVVQLTRGVNWYSTPSHGGLSVTLQWAERNLTAGAQELGERLYGRLWYEEDCLCSAVFYEHPELDKATGQERTLEDIRESNARVLRSYYPQYFEPEFHRVCRENPVNPILQVGDTVRLTTRSYLVSSVQSTDYTVNITAGGYNPGLFRLRKAHVLENATAVYRCGRQIWTRASSMWAEMQLKKVSSAQP